ncbi:hypothetical protein B0J17DRAFT_628734 [Rhizoctonia solani]|nr:hypothetical protein B0J17DRAFT_628734 [Rhizoctonia solani]
MIHNPLISRSKLQLPKWHDRRIATSKLGFEAAQDVKSPWFSRKTYRKNCGATQVLTISPAVPAPQYFRQINEPAPRTSLTPSKSIFWLHTKYRPFAGSSPQQWFRIFAIAQAKTGTIAACRLIDHPRQQTIHSHEFISTKDPIAAADNTVELTMEGQQRPPPHSVSGSSNNTSSSSVPSMSTITTPDQTKSPFSTSPSGRVSFVFPQTQRSLSRAAPKAAEAVALHELPSTDILSSSVSEPSPGQGSKAVFGPNRLRLVTDDALDNLLGSSPRHGHTIYGRDQSSVQAWVELNQTSRSKGSKRKPDGGEPS